nr:uncharacterized protein LOC128677397 [Plodia interpunctella]
MLSKFLNLAARCPPSKNHFKKAVPPPLLYNWQKAAPQINSVRVMSHLIPPSQYDMPWPKRMKFFYVVVNYWETIPLFACTAFALLILFISIYNACANKADVVFSTRSRSNNSRTMDLRNPRVLKMFVITQRYDPWPEMQDVLDKMKSEEIRVARHPADCP